MAIRRKRETPRERESGRETGRGWSWLESGERWREPRDPERERAAKRVERQGEAGEWTVESVGETETERAAE
jgi:hypothetical protein